MAQTIDAHTPGPWSQSHRLNKRGLYSTEVYDAAGEEIATLAWYPVKAEHGVGTNRDANARLIAAAPDMADALRAFISAHSNHCYVTDAYKLLEQARDAISKATGET